MNVPSCSRRTLRLTADEIAADDRVTACSLLHVRKRGNAFVCAEGDSFAHVLYTGTTDLYGFGEHIAAYLSADDQVRYLDRSATRDVPPGLTRIRSVTDAEGKEYAYAIGTAVVVHLPREEGSTACGLLTNTAVAAYRERLFAVSGRTVKFSRLLDFSGEGWQEDEAEQGRSTFTLHPAGGDIVDMLPAHGKLVFLREYGISTLTAYADVYNFRLADVAYDCGAIVKGSGASLCGDVYFFTDRGLCVFNGTSAARAEGAMDEEIDVAQAVRISVQGNTLYASVTKRDGTAALYAYDPAEKCGRFLLNAFEKLSAGEGGYLMRDGMVYQLGGRAVPSGKSCALSFTCSLTEAGDGEKRVEAVVVEGTGQFVVSLAGENGTAEASGAANTRIGLPFSVRGELFTLTVSASDGGFRIDAVALCFRKEDRV